MNLRFLPVGLALLLGIPLFAQTPSQQSPAAPSQAPDSASGTQGGTPAGSAAPDKPAKKVWTDDDLNSEPHPTGSSRSAGTARPTPVRGGPNASNAKWYRDQIAKLQSKIPPIDSQIATYRDALNGKEVPSSGMQLGHYKLGDLQQEIAKLEKQRADIQDQINNLQDRARRAGIRPGDLRQ
jgi:hypothetical protein